ncbi:WXG100 family type VII secretion target [Rhodococcus sp. BP-252]|uniref:ESAT-6-like protein n=1 Tax=Rhodococcoides kyotonense TaxID=398843 RepID=A0A177Y711_9NOCA|nr:MULTISPECIES: WXG100 family type VII secretion target [Rhodococcus]MBY6410538.1 WXG100 family type VII secretion target [Rhodococcus sp. BP-320]MBY6417833.1 WXG100 family type VII secretion target [Rhodococcus sp. BP-321]MBY6422828.1 WXG100 family type VII secretion target [Rhodococcus sp. BP-324]MBY6425094.1 WXG100 family type VII secretion target [Rhodococcus sp. BP-323]MBY6430200.1 WXG100 family type VII secretion target [Rhodococcus sp. BP-322]
MADANIDTMLAVAAKVDGLRDQIAGQLRALRGDVDLAASGIWKGAASTTFAQVMTNWDASAFKLENALAGISQAIKTSGVEYDQSEQDNVSSINSVAGTLNL